MNLKTLSDDELKSLKYKLEGEIAKLNNGQMSKKILMNSEYGALASMYFRYYDIRMAAAITLSGQLAIRWIENYLMNHPAQKKYNYKVVYSDTDSLYVCIDRLGLVLEKKLGGDTDKILQKINMFSDKIIQPIINEGYKKLAEYVNANENRMFMKREKIASSGFWTGKKKYALHVYDDEGVRYKEPKLKVTGIETVRSSTPKMIKKELEKILEMILTDYSGMNVFIQKVKEKFFKSTPEDIALTMSVNTYNRYVETFIPDIINIDEDDLFIEPKLVMAKNLDEVFKINDIDYSTIKLTYKKRTPIAVRASVAHNQFIMKNKLYGSVPLIRVKDKVKYVFLKEPNPYGENVFAFLREMPDKNKSLDYIDFPTQFYKTFLKPIENITKKLKLKVGVTKTTNLNDI